MLAPLTGSLDQNEAREARRTTLRTFGRYYSPLYTIKTRTGGEESWLITTQNQPATKRFVASVMRSRLPRCQCIGGKLQHRPHREELLTRAVNNQYRRIIHLHNSPRQGRLKSTAHRRFLRQSDLVIAYDRKTEPYESIFLSTFCN